MSAKHMLDFCALGLGQYGSVTTYFGHPLTFIQLICKNFEYEGYMDVPLLVYYWYYGLKYGV